MSVITEQAIRDRIISTINDLRKTPPCSEMFGHLIFIYNPSSEQKLLYQSLFQEMKVTKEEFKKWYFADNDLLHNANYLGGLLVFYFSGKLEQANRDEMISAIDDLRKTPPHPWGFYKIIMAYANAIKENNLEESGFLHQTLFEEMKVSENEFEEWGLVYAKNEGYDAVEGTEGIFNFFFS